MANQIYENVFLENEIEDQLNSRLDLARFCVAKDGLTVNPGMKYVVNVYTATTGTEVLEMGEGNSETIETRLESREYDILLAQNRFKYYDEEVMTDPTAINVGISKGATDIYNKEMSMIYGEFMKLPTVITAAAFDFDAFADAVAALNVEEGREEKEEIFAFICNADLAALRKALKNSLEYVEAFARSGYVGTVAGVNIYVRKNAYPGKVAVATREAVSIFNKRGVSVEQERTDANKRENTVYTRKYFVPALTDETKGVIIQVGDDLTLKSLTGVALTPGFEPGILTYNATTSEASVTLVGTASDSGATVAYKCNGSTASGGVCTLNAGANKLEVTVTKSSKTLTYVVNVTKLGE